MKLSTAAELAIRGMMELAKNHDQGHVNLESICASGDLPRQYLSKIFNTLVRAGLVKPVRGKHGGYKLARAPGRINLLQIVEAIEGPLAINFCQHTPSQCAIRDCAIRPVWGEIQRFIRKKLSSTTLAMCLPHAAELK